MYKFIIVDDENIVCETFGQIMDWAEIGYEFAGAFTSAESAYDFLRENTDISLVITDINMLGMSGIEFARRLRRDFGNIGIIILSGYEEFEYAREAIKLKVIEYIVKPISYSKLSQAMENAKEYICQYDSVARPQEETPVKNEFISNIDMIEEYVEQHISEKIVIEDVANYLNISPNYLGRYFKKNTGENFTDYISRKKIEYAVVLLKDPGMRINEICDRVGYGSMRHFLRLFKRYTGITPTKMRKVGYKNDTEKE